MPKHVINQLCPICEVTYLQHVHCANASCVFFVTTCPKCDREQAVRAFVDDHQADCEHYATAPFLRQRVA